MRKVLAFAGASVASLLMTLSIQPATASSPSFTNTALFATAPLPAGVTTSPSKNSTGNSEPAIAFGADGAMAVDGLGWLPYQVNLWQGSFGQTPDYFGAMDTKLDGPGVGRTWFGDGDADLAITDAGTTLLADLNFVVSRRNYQLGVSVTRCSRMASGPDDCTTKLLDQAGADREWITSVGTKAWVSYHDSASSTLIRVKKSTDDGRTWSAAGSPIPGQGAVTGSCTFNNEIGPLASDPVSGDIYAIYICGDTVTKGRAFTGNNVVVSRSTDGGAHWRATVAYHGDRRTQLANIFPSIAVDPANGNLYATASTLEGVYVSSSTDQGRTWSAPVKVSAARTVVMPWIAAMNGKVDVVYYGTSAGSIDDETAVWNVYDSQWLNGAWTVKKVSNTPNRVGAVCLNGSGCEGNRELLDLFEVAEDPVSGKAAIIYTDTTISTWTEAGVQQELPEIVLAFEK